MKTRESILGLSTLAFAIVLSGCGGGSGSFGGGGSGGGNGGGGGGNGGVSISLLAPSSIMIGVPLGSVNISGTGFGPQSQVLVDGSPAILTILLDPGTLEAEIGSVAFWSTPATHQLSVQQGGQTSNSLPFTVYAPQPGQQVVQAAPSFLVSSLPIDQGFIATGDLNGDGLADVVVQGPTLPTSATTSSGTLAIFYGQADGSLSDVHYLSPSEPAAVAIGDVDGDGNADLVTINNASTVAVTVWLGDGHGNFQPVSSPEPLVGSFNDPAQLVDLDGDGKLDLVLGIHQSTAVVLVWFQNTGGGSFAAPVTLATEAADNGSFSIADFNGDGKPDILYTAPGSPESLHILMNQGTGHFNDQVVTGLNGIIGRPSVLDYNLDGIPDLVLQVPQGAITLYSFTGNGNGSFTQAGSTIIGSSQGFGTYDLHAGDFDHDGFPDLAGVNGETEPSHILYLFGDGHGNFVPQEFVGPYGFYSAVGDVNGDGIPDVVVVDRLNFVTLALGRTDRNFPSPLPLSPATATGAQVGDVNGDGFPEILISGDPIHGVASTLYLNQGNNSFQVAAYLDPGAFGLNDLTGRGVADLLGESTHNLIIWPNNGSLDFSSSPITIPQPMADITVADMDGDGLADIVALGQVFYNDGSYQFSHIATATTFTWPYVLGDFNGDHRLDIAAGGATFLNAGGRTFTQTPGGAPLGNGILAVVADFNGDGLDDIAAVFPGDQAISIWYGRGDGSFYEGTEVDPGQYAGALAVGDFNGDGRPDLAVGLILSHQVCLFFNDGKGEFTRSFFASGADTNSMLAADLNKDGKPDLVITNYMLSFRPPNVDVIFHK